MMGVFSKVAPLFLLLAALLLGSCQQPLAPGNPALPIGFRESQLPDVEANGYVYVRQKQPFMLSSKKFQPDPRKPLPPGLPPHTNIGQITMIMGPSMNTFGGVVEFSSEGEAALASQLLQQQASRQWVTLSGEELFLVRGENVWSRSLKEALTQERRLSLSQKFPEVWETISLLPENPPGEPVAAGFVRVDAPLLESLAGSAGVGLRSLTPSLGFMRLDHIAFAVYADHTLQIPEKVDSTFISEQELGAVLIAHSGYPGFIVSIAMSILGSRGGLLETITLGDTEVRYMPLSDLHLLIKNKGSFIFAAISADRATAEALMKSALSP